MIPLVRPSVPPIHGLLQYLERSRDAGQYSNFGPVWNQAVKKLNERTGRYCLPVTNGTTAIQLALMSVFQPGARIAVPDYTHVGTLHAVVQAGMEPIIFGCDPETWTIDRTILLQYRDTYDGVLVVSPFGYYVDFKAYDAFSRSMRKPVIYDLAGAWGMPIHETNSICTFSFHATKNFACGEGGVVCFQNDLDLERGRLLSNFWTNPDRKIGSAIAGNFKIDEFKSAQICWHLDNHKLIEQKIQRKRSAIDFYQEFLGELIDSRGLHRHPYAAPSLCVFESLGLRDDIEQAAQRHGVMVKQYYIPLHTMPGLESVRRFGVAMAYLSSNFALPSDCTDDELDRVVEVVKKLHS